MCGDYMLLVLAILRISLFDPCNSDRSGRRTAKVTTCPSDEKVEPS